VAALAGLLLAACAAHPPAPPVADLPRLRGFLYDEPAPPFQLRGTVQITYRGQLESGELLLRSGPGDAHVLQLRARMTGSLALELRFDDLYLLVLDYVHETYFRGFNDPETRLDQFSTDLNPEEFRMAVTGRVPRRVFEEGGGVYNGAGEAAFSVGLERYVFTLDAQGLPQRWVKLSGGQEALRVEYRGTVEVPSASGPPVRLPERVRVYVGEARPRLVLGVREYLPAAVTPLTAADLQLPADLRERFRPQ